MPGEPSQWADQPQAETQPAAQQPIPPLDGNRLQVSPETESALQRYGVYNKPGEYNPLKGLNRAVMNPAMGLLGGGLQTMGDLAGNVLKGAGMAGDAVSPGLGRDLAGMGEMALNAGGFGTAGKMVGTGFSRPNMGWMNPAKTAASGVRENAIARNLAAVNDAQTARASAIADASNSVASAIRSERLASQLGGDASLASSAQSIAETPRLPVSSPFGAPPSSMAMGQATQDSAIAQEAALRSARSSAYDAGTAKVNEAVASREAAGQFLKNDPDARAMLSRSQDALNDTPIPGSPATMRLSSSDRMAHEAIVSALEGRPVEIPQSAVGQAIADGHQVKTIPGDPPRYQVTFSNTVDGLNNVRRMFGEAFKSDVPGWGAINSALKKELYGGLNDVLKSYVGDAYTARQAAYRDASPAIDAYGTKTAKALVGDQKGTLQPSSTPNALADALRQADPSVLSEVAKLSGQDVLPAVVARAFHDPVTGMSIPLDAARKVTAPGTKLADALSLHPELNAAVEKHISALAAEEAAKSQQALFAQQQGAISAQKMAAQLDATKSASVARAGAADATALAAEHGANATSLQQDIANLQNMPSKEVLPAARAMLERMSPAKGGTMSMADYVAAKAQLDKAQSTAAIQKRLLQIVGAGLVVSGTPPAGRFIYNSITGGP